MHYRLVYHETVDLVERALQMAINIRWPKAGLMFHSDRGSQYTSGRFSRLLSKYKITASISNVSVCLDKAVVERFVGSLKYEWLLNIVHLTRETMKMDIEEYIHYYSHERLHTTLGDLTPINYEIYKKKRPVGLDQNTNRCTHCCLLSIRLLY